MKAIFTEEFGLVSLQDYLALLQIQSMESKGKKAEVKPSLCSLISNKAPNVLSKEEVLEVFVQYVKKYRNGNTVFDIPVGTKYMAYSQYILAEITQIFPNIRWRLLYINENIYMCRGESQ